MNKKKNNKKYSNNKYKIIPFEKFKLNTLYSFSFNPEDQHETTGIPLVHIDNAFKKMMDSLHGVQYRVYREISPAPNCRQHYHGYIRFIQTNMDLYHIYTKQIRQICLKGSVEIDEINDYEIWNTYCTKQILKWNDDFQYMGTITPEELLEIRNANDENFLEDNPEAEEYQEYDNGSDSDAAYNHSDQDEQDEIDSDT